MPTPVRKGDPFAAIPAAPAPVEGLVPFTASTSSTVNSTAIIQSARYEDIARRVIMGQTTTEIAADLQMSSRHVRRYLQDPQMGEIYRRIHEEFYADLDKIIKDEKIEPLRRAHAQAIRAQSIVSEILDEVRSRIQSGTARATDLKVGADTAFGIIDRSKGPLSTVVESRASVQIKFDMTGDKTRLLRETIQEAGIDLSDLGFTEAVLVPPEEMENEPPPPVPAHDASSAGR